MYPPNLIFVKRHPNGTDGDYISENRISGIHWDNITGGICIRTGRFFLMGYIDPAGTSVARSGRHNYARNGIKVCIIKTKTHPEVWKRLVEQYGPNPSDCEDRKAPCTKRILQFLEENGPMERHSLRHELLCEHYKKNTIRKALKTMASDGRIILTGSSMSCYQVISLARESAF